MRYHRNAPEAFVVCSLLLVLATVPAYGYVDPNATGLISQILTPLLIAAAASVTFLRKRVGAALTWLARRLRGRSGA